MALPLLVDIRFQVLFHSPNRGAFHLSLTVLVHYRSLGSIQPCEMVLADSHGVPRAPWYLGRDSKEPAPFSPTGLLPSMAALSRALRLTGRFVTPRPPREGVRIDPATPAEQCSHACTHDRFGLFPFRSPLLRESRLLSVPGGTEMVHFPPFAPPSL